MDEPESKICSNCKREIPAVNYTIHTVHCARNIKVCPVCKEPVPHTELQEHHDKLHKLLPCKQCGENVCGTDLEDHIRDSCGNTIKSCRFCELELPRKELPFHEGYCGVRTEQCPDCREWVMIKYRQLHLDSNHGFLKLDDDPAPIPRREPVKSQIKPLAARNINLLPSTSSVSRSTEINWPSLPKTNMPSSSTALQNGEVSSSWRSPANSAKPPLKRTNDQPQINTDVTAVNKVNKEIAMSRGAVKKRPAPRPPIRDPPTGDPRRDMAYYSALKRQQSEERERQRQSAINMAAGLPPVLSPAAKLEKLRKLDALQNREVQTEDYKNCLQGRIWNTPQIEPGHVLGSGQNAIDNPRNLFNSANGSPNAVGSGSNGATVTRPKNINLDPEYPRNINLDPSYPRNINLDPDYPRNINLDPSYPRNINLDPEYPRNINLDPGYPRNLNLINPKNDNNSNVVQNPTPYSRNAISLISSRGDNSLRNPSRVTNGANSTPNGVNGSTNGASSSTDGANSSTNGAGSSTEGVNSARNGITSSRNGPNSTQNAVSSSRNGANNTQNGVSSSRNDAHSGALYDGNGSQIEFLSSTPTCDEDIEKRRQEFKNLKPMTPQEFMERFNDLQLGRDRRPERGDRFSEIKSSLRELRRGLNEVTAPYNSTNNISTRRSPDASPTPDDEVRLPCEFCGVPVPAEDLVQHQTGCRPDLAQYRPKSPARMSPIDQDMMNSATAVFHEDPLIPCEFCTESLPVYLITEHQERCGRESNMLYAD